MDNEILVAKAGSELVYLKLDVKDGELDGRVQRPEGSTEIPFWSYVTKVPVEPILSTPFHKELWNGDTRSEEWQKKFFTRETPFTEKDLLWARSAQQQDELPESKPIISKTLATGIAFPVR